MSSNKSFSYFTVVYYLYIVFVNIVICASTVHRSGQVICKEIPGDTLEEILGAAFNGRYMSIDKPVTEAPTNGKRTVDESLDFYVDNSFQEDDDNRPAWNLKNHVANHREKRNTRLKNKNDYMQEWHCTSNIKWTDLGPDYFPRYLRSVECSSDRCWFNIYKCKSRSFAVKVLRRIRNRCVVAKPGTTVGNVGLPTELKELWVWEERALSFCCDCSM